MCHLARCELLLWLALLALPAVLLGCTSQEGSGGRGGSAGVGGAAGLGGMAGGAGDGGAGGQAGAGGVGGQGGAGAQGGAGGRGGAGGASNGLCPPGYIDVVGDGSNCRCDCRAECAIDDCGCSAPVRFAITSDGEELDCITPDVCLSRQAKGPLINAVVETEYDKYTSPLGAEWTRTSCALAGHDQFAPMGEAFWYAIGSQVLYREVCLRLVDSGLRYDMDFLVWEEGPQGGAVEYVRTPYFADECAHVDAACGEVCECPPDFEIDLESGVCAAIPVAPAP